MSSCWGNKIKISIFGGSHTEAIGVTIDGLPAGERINTGALLLQMSRRAPGQDKTATARKEADIPEILCGLLDGVTTGAPLTAIIRNTNQHSKDYSDLKVHPRPGHADYTAYLRYQGNNDIRGGGHFSGRLTAPMVLAGAICRQILERRGVRIAAHALSIADVMDSSFDPVEPDRELMQRLNSEYFAVIDPAAKEEMYQAIESARLSADSVGGTVECVITGLPAGLGDPMFGRVENVVSSIVFGIPAVKGLSFGAGFKASELRGSENNDTFYYDGDTVKTKTNNAGGVLGGITSGMPVVFTTVFKATPSIGMEQDTVDLENKTDSKLVIKGRHDPCIVPRAISVVEAAAALAALELMS